MQFSGEGYIIKVKNYGEKSAILTLICPQHGKIVGFVSGALQRRNLGTFQPGNYISFNAYARVEENMLNLKGIELLHAHTADFMLDTDKVGALSSLCRLLDVCVAENDNLGRLYSAVSDFFKNIQAANWLVYYSFFEFYLLDFLGVGLDMNACAVTGRTDGLTYVSPKTGRAVCAEVGEPYREKLYAYPHYIVDKNYMPKYTEVADLLKMTGNFLNKNFLQNHNLQLPENRANLLNVVKLYHKL